MNETTIKISLLEVTNEHSPSGSIKGQEVFNSLVSIISSQPAVRIVAISLLGIQSTDATFPRESVVSVAKHFRGEVGLYLCDLDLLDVSARDFIANWGYAAAAKDQPLVLWDNDTYELIGPITAASAPWVHLVLSKGPISAAQVAVEFETSVQNASTRLKRLVDQGYFMRSEVSADSGGIEFIYHAIK
ncbi:helix-turn-helix domain-containing protein [Herbaspirillum sp. CAH-3]|jgi:hypothetical protein|uniref:MarR family transcriptional regulator n=1 Tax=Herbaspirillum sp. CAH-3 TaxID=2605746 RepID=UPI0012ACCEF8|nr:DNA-binding protein [Herbaspirillum sp. CAH-3]MRT30426.1 DNA-binding protein [Herbaspirillum sp. CAH-3]